MELYPCIFWQTENCAFVCLKICLECFVLHDSFKITLLHRLCCLQLRLFGLFLSEHALVFAPPCCHRTNLGPGVNDILLPNGPPSCASGVPSPPRTKFALSAARERCLSIPEIGEKERNYLFQKLYRLRVMTSCLH